MTAAFHVTQAGPHVSVQDGGRAGFLRFGVPASGAVDPSALTLANAALGNALGATGVEVSPGGLALQLIHGTVSIAVAGGGFIVEKNGHPGGSWGVLSLTAGDRLVIRPGPWGNWCVLAFAGHLQAPSWLGSQATHMPSGLGGGGLTAGQEWHIAAPRTLPDAAIPCPIWARPSPVVPVVLGPQDQFFAADILADFLSRPFRMTAEFDRMGLRLTGPRLPSLAAMAIPSEGLLRGAVQVSGDGVTTVLLADHGTTGGYPKIATLPGVEVGRLAQTRPGQLVTFRAISAAAAVQMARQRAAILQACVAGLRRRAPDLDH